MNPVIKDILQVLRYLCDLILNDIEATEKKAQEPKCSPINPPTTTTIWTTTDQEK